MPTDRNATMASFLKTVCKSTGEERYYLNSGRVSRSQWDALKRDYPVQDCFLTVDKDSHWHHHHSGRKK